MIGHALVILLSLTTIILADPIKGTKCAKNQVINRLTVFEDGALEAECGQIPCGMSGMRCIEDQTSCRADTDVFSGMRWAANGQSVLLRCCTLKVSNKIYVGTDLVSAGSYYVGGPVAQKDLYGQGGAEYDFIANIRTEQGGVRVWVYRIMCPTNGGESVQPQESVQEAQPAPADVEEDRQTALNRRREYLMNKLGGKARAQQEATQEEEETAENNDEQSESVTVDEQAPFNPLRYRPPTKH